jgi:hypothetical protein
MTFGHAIVEGIICVGFFVVLMSQGAGITRDETLPRRKKKNTNQRKRKFDSAPPNTDLRASTRRRADSAQSSPKAAPTLTTPSTSPKISTFPKISRSDDVHRIDPSLKDRQTLFVESDNGRPIYVVPRNTSSEIYIARHLASKHTVQKLGYARIYLPTLFPSREVRYYTPRENHEDDFFVVINKEDLLLPLIRQFPFDRLREHTASSASEDTNQVVRQAAKVNRGFTSTMSMAQRGDNGVPVRHLKNGSRNPCIQSAHLIASSIIRQVTLPSIGHPINEDPDHQWFAGEIAEGNIAEASTCYSLGQNCAWHCDFLNPVPPNDDSSWVMNVNHVFGDGSTLAALFY